MKTNSLASLVLLAASLPAAAVTYEEWKAVHFSASQLANPNISGPMADPDRDGIPNLTEYATGTDPWIPNRPAAKLTGTGADGRLTMTYPRRKDHPGILYAVQGCPSLTGGWRSGPDFMEETSVVDIDADWELVTVRDRESTATSRVRFMRLLVAVDSDNDGLPDDWEMAVFGSLTAQSGWDDFDLDGLSNLMEWQHGSDPKDYYNGNRPLGIPAAPSAVSVSINLSGGMDVTWNDNSNNETGFVISMHHHDGTLTELSRTGVNATAYHVSTISAASIGVAAFNPEGVSAEAMEDLPGGIAIAPRQPALSVNRLNRNKVRLAWIASASDDPAATDAVHIYRSVDDSAWVDMTQFAPVPVSPARWDDTAAPDHRYQYTVVIERNITGSTQNPAARLASYAAIPVADYYLDVEIQFTSVSGDPFPEGNLTGYGFIPDTWTADSIPPASAASWTLTGSSLRKKGVLKWEVGSWQSSGIGGTLGGEWDSDTAMAAYPLAVDWHGTNLLAPNLFSIQPWRIEAAVGNGHSDIQTFCLSHSQGIWIGDTYEPSSLPGTEIPKGFDGATLPNALMVPQGGGNKVYYYDPSSYLPTGTNATVSIVPGAGFTTDPAGPVDVSVTPVFSLTISGSGSAAGSVLTASRATANTRKLALVPMKTRPGKVVSIYSVRLVDDNGMPVLDLQTRFPFVGLAPAAASLQSALNGIFTTQANLSFLVQSPPGQPLDINYSHHTGPGSGALNVDAELLDPVTHVPLIDPSTGRPFKDLGWQIPFNNIANGNGADFTLFYVYDILSEEEASGAANAIPGKWAVIASKHRTDDQLITPFALLWTATHETGHLLGLRHIFDFTVDPGKPATHMLLYPEPDMDRLMDYHSKFRLTRPECEKINPPTP